MTEGSDGGTFESRFANVLDSIDEASKKLESSIKQRRRKNSEEENASLIAREQH